MDVKRRIGGMLGRSGCDLPYRILIGTHHKTGTVWLSSIFRAICQEHSLIFFMGAQADLPAQYDVFLQHHSEFDLDALGPLCRGLHMIRDPRDVIVSGCFYHQTSEEEWLHTPFEALQGRTYQEALNRCDTLDEKLQFEMEHAGKRTIEAMANWNYAQSSFLELKYEDLIRDTDLTLFRKALTFVGFPESMLPSLLAIAYNNSLFSGQPEKSGHIRSGAARQWEKYFKGRHKERFLEMFGDVLIRLGYEADDTWATSEDMV
jgi:hypothetical protein